MRQVGALIADVLENIASDEVIASVRRRVGALTEAFPLYAWKMERAGAR
jgi:glycine/serine hydroxymethyltransferase